MKIMPYFELKFGAQTILCSVQVLPHVIASRRRGNLKESQNSKIKMQNDKAKFRNVVRGFSLVRTTLKGRTTKGEPASQWQKEEANVSLIIFKRVQGCLFKEDAW